MANALTMLHDLGHKVAKHDKNESRILQVNMNLPVPVDIEFTNITLEVSLGMFTQRTKTILKGVSGRYKSGQLTAIMGPSGAGKSSLLNALTGFSTGGVTGKIRAGDSLCELSKGHGSLRSLASYRKKSCYILQDDRLNPLFTVHELMTFAADMKIGNALTEIMKQSVISEVLETLGLRGTEHTRCNKLSGGQRKRLSIAVELIDNPPVIFLDEPTTGLDSLSSAQCIEMLKKLAYSGRTVVCTVHQPSASIYSMFDQVYILADGMCIYRGTSENTVPYMATLGFQCPMYHNPADYVLEIANGEYGNFNEMLSTKLGTRDHEKDQIEQRCPPLEQKCPALEQKCPVLDQRCPVLEQKCPVLEQRCPPVVRVRTDAFHCGKTAIMIRPPHEMHRFGVLLKRAIIQQYRDWTVTHLKLALHLLTGVLLGLLYYRAGQDAAKTISNFGFLIVSAVYLTYTSLMPAVLRFPSELPVLKKENFNNWYSLRTYYAAVLLTGIPIQICFSLVYATTSYFLSGQPAELPRFLMFALVLAIITVLSDAIGNVIGTLFNPVNGTFLGAILTCVMIVFTGFLALFKDMSAFMSALSHVSFMRYGFEALALALYGGHRAPLVCHQLYCHLKYPTEVLKQFSLKNDNYWIDVLVLLAEICVMRVLAYYTLRLRVKSSS